MQEAVRCDLRGLRLVTVTTVDGVTDLRQVWGGPLSFAQVGGVVVMLALGAICLVARTFLTTVVAPDLPATFMSNGRPWSRNHVASVARGGLGYPRRCSSP